MITALFSRPRIKKSALQALQACPWKNIELPSAVADVPTMLYTNELQVLHWLAKHHVNGAGRIVDAGCFLGGSTAALASGLAARTDGPWEKTIASYDRFHVEDYTIENFGDKLSNPRIDASFRPDFDRYTAPWARHVEVREGDAIKIGWSGEPIEVLFLDLVKTWDLNDLFMDQFLPSLIPGRSIIIHQDYMWGWGPWIHITMELLAPYVTVLDSMLCSVVYVLTKPIPRKFFGARLREQLSRKAKFRLMDRAVNRWNGPLRGLVELARVMLFREQLTAAIAQAELEKVLARYPEDSVIQTCGNQAAVFISNRSWWANA